MSCAVGPRHGSDLMLLWLWCRPAAAALIQPLAWELPYAPRAAQERGKNTKNLLLLLRCHGALLVPSLTWELLRALGVAQNKQKTNKQKNKKQQQQKKQVGMISLKRKEDNLVYFKSIPVLKDNISRIA